MKRKVLSFLIIFICFLSLTSCKKKKNVNIEFPELVQDLSSYQIEGELESYFPSGTKICSVVVYYKQPDLYRVEIQNPNDIDTQIMVKNEKGVFVLIPSINKTFKINSSWPQNMSYSYLLQSLKNDLLSDENQRITTDGDNTIIELKAKLFTQDESTTQKITFGADKLPKEVALYDNNKNLITRFIFKNIKQNPNLSNDLFDVDVSLESMASIYEESPVSFERVISYPTYFPEGSSLKEEQITGSILDRLAVMKFGGTTNYTIVEKYINKSDSKTCEYVNGDIYIMSGVFCFIDDNNVMFYENGIEYMVASNEISCLEMIKMGDSLREALTK